MQKINYMKKITLALVLGSFLLSTQTSFAQQKNVTAKPQKALGVIAKEAPNQEEMMKTWQAYATPTEVHKMLATSDGEWVGEVSHWMAPDDKAMVSKCRATNKMVMGGRYQQSEMKGEFMGMPFEGMSLLAYDNAQKIFINSWVDNMGTGMMVLKGKWDDKTKSITFKGKCVDPMTGKDCEVREIFTIVDDNTQTMVMYGQRPDGKGEFKTMEINFKRG